jgi:GTPase Era involved in 16S rRNA processing
MRNKIAIKVVNEEIETLGLPKISSLGYLNNEEPIIYLCGKSSTGKTTFLNALFNFKKDELYTSTDISTKTEFRFKYGLEEKITTIESKEITLPTTYIERKKLFESLNREGEKYIINLDEKTIVGRTIVDIPGVFDFKRNNNFSNQMLNEADIVYFFTPCTGKINSTEHELLKNISNAGIPIIVLFTMGDLIDADEGITRKTMPNLVESRLKTCFVGINISHHQIISANDFYKGKELHGIDKLQVHINSSDHDYKIIAEDKRLKKSVNYYIDLLNERIINLEKESKTFINLVYRENELWQEAEKKNVDDEKHKTINALESELNWFYKNCEDIIYGKSYSKIFRKVAFSLEEQKEKFETTWSDFWLQTNEGFDFSIPKLPDFNLELFEQVTIDLDKFKSIMGSESSTAENKDSSKNSNKKEQKETTVVKDNSIKKTEPKKNEATPKGAKADKLSLADFVVLISEVGLNLKNGRIIYKKWSFLFDVKEIIENHKKEFNKQLDIEFKKKTDDIEIEMKQRIDKSLLENNARKIIDSYENVLIKFKSIIDDI